jgi:hypothetical protein
LLLLLCKSPPPLILGLHLFTNLHFFHHSLAMILNLSIGEEIEQDAKEIEGHHIPADVLAGPSSSHSVDVIEKAEPKNGSSTVTPV